MRSPRPSGLSELLLPITCYDLYNLLTREVTHAPNTVDAQKRQGLLVFAGDLLTRKPDLEDLPPRIDWDQRRVEQASSYQRV
jgi:hypothetical protein